MSFSGAVVLTDLNDFITPSQACIKPVEIKKTANIGQAQTNIRIDDTGGYYEVSQDGGETKLETASISLNDCLACSGCITSAESVLITMQSQKELYEILQSNKAAIEQGRIHDVKTVVISVAPQSRASIAAKYNINPLEVHKRLLWFFKQYLGVHYVFDTAFTRDFSLLESAKEFVRRYQQHHSNPDGGVLPMLASACPGWICYAEKTHDYILPHIDSTKSPQQIMGSLVKYYLGSKLGLTPNQVYHVSVMPCYDKKLEASRQDFYNDVYSTRDVDCVVTTGEVEKMFAEQNLNIASIPTTEIESLFTKAVASPITGIPMLAGTEGSSSGGYLSYIFRYAAAKLFNIHLTLEDVELGQNGVQIRIGRNVDFKEYTLVLPSNPSTTLLRFAIAYGFRNIQNLVRKLKPASTSAPRRRATATATSSYDYIEIMACPSGCINGGGQLKPHDFTSPSVPKEWVARTEEAYRWVAQQGGVQFPEANAAIGVLYNEWLGGEDTEKARRLLHTGYRAVEKANVSGLAVKW